MWSRLPAFAKEERKRERVDVKPGNYSTIILSISTFCL